MIDEYMVSDTGGHAPGAGPGAGRGNASHPLLERLVEELVQSVYLEDSELFLAALGRKVHHLPRGPGFRISSAREFMTNTQAE